jgi:WhiB family redox-sensing transcriptional regulator
MADFSRLPGPNADLWDWQLLAACRGVDSSLFFHPEGERGAARSARENSAKEVCMRCPVRAECAAHALSTREPYGVWGGFTESERLRLLATGWEDLADRRHSRIDVVGLEVRLGIRPAMAAPLREFGGPTPRQVAARSAAAS